MTRRAPATSALPAILALVALAGAAPAHEVRPAYLQLRQRAPDTYDVVWKVPARGGLRLALDVELPADARMLAPPRAERASGSVTERFSFRRPGGLGGARIGVAGLSGTRTDVLLRLERLDGSSQVARLTPASPSVVVEDAPDRAEVAATYFGLGVEHILLGFDHLLFVLALLLLVRGARRLAATVTAFTAAHSVTLAAATLGWLRVAAAPVEACIALSVMFVAAEIVHEGGGRPGLTARRPWGMAFGFGLLHGLGFAGALREAGLPETAIPVVLLFFNLGVEAGQLAFVGAVLAVFALARRGGLGAVASSPVWGRLAPAYAIGGVAAYWLLQRLGGVLAVLLVALALVPAPAAARAPDAAQATREVLCVGSNAERASPLRAAGAWCVVCAGARAQGDTGAGRGAASSDGPCLRLRSLAPLDDRPADLRLRPGSARVPRALGFDCIPASSRHAEGTPWTRRTRLFTAAPARSAAHLEQSDAVRERVGRIESLEIPELDAVIEGSDAGWFIPVRWTVIRSTGSAAYEVAVGFDGGIVGVREIERDEPGPEDGT